MNFRLLTLQNDVKRSFSAFVLLNESRKVLQFDVLLNGF
jgi:hypothetical protein